MYRALSEAGLAGVLCSGLFWNSPHPWNVLAAVFLVVTTRSITEAERDRPC